VVEDAAPDAHVEGGGPALGELRNVTSSILE